MRGDPPYIDGTLITVIWSTPHARGSTLEKKQNDFKTIVYPACAGIHRYRFRNRSRLPGLPRMRGDPPVL